MQIVLLRHAQKGLTPFSDPELTAEGHAQAQGICRFVESKQLPTPTHLWGSEKIRTRQTLEPIEKTYLLTFQQTDSLDLRGNNESSSEFRQRIQKFLNSFQDNHSKNETHFICTHYDWIEEAMTLINCDKDLNSFEFSHWAPGQFLHLLVTDSLWKFVKKGTPPKA